MTLAIELLLYDLFHLRFIANNVTIGDLLYTNVLKIKIINAYQHHLFRKVLKCLLKYNILMLDDD